MAAVQGSSSSALSQALLASVAPDYQTNQMQAQRRLELANALQQQSMQDTPGNGGSVSWTQGLARLVDAIAAKRMAKQGYSQLQTANQSLGQSMGGMVGRYGQAPQMGQGAPPAPSGAPAPQMPPQAPQGAPAQTFVPGAPVPSGQDDPLAVQPSAPPQAAPPQPAAAPMPPQGGAPQWQPGAMSLTGTPADRAMLFSNPDEYSKAVIANAAKSGAPLDAELKIAHARQALASGDIATATALLGGVEKDNYIAPTAARPGGWTQDPHTGQWMFHPQAPIPGAVPGALDAQGNMTWQVPAGTEAAIAQRAKSQSAGESAGKAPYQFQDVYNPATGQMEHVPVSEMAGQGGSLNQYYGHGAPQGGAPGAPPGGGHYAAAPPIGATAAANTYGQGSAQGALETQNSAEGSQIRVQAYREMQNLLHGGLSTGPTQARMQELAEEHGLSFLAKDNAFVFNKDAALAVAQQAKALGLNSSDARFEAVARATPNMKMTPQALAQVIPVRIGMEYASQAEATANANWIAQHGPQTNPQFKNYWRQNYDPRMFTAYAQGGPQALAHAPPQLRQQWLSDYRNLKALGVNFGQFAQ